MVRVNLNVRGDKKLQRALRESPERIANSIQDALKGSVQIMSQTTTEDANYNWKLPRSKRSGYFALGFNSQYATIGRLQASMTTNVNYKEYAYNYHKRRGNDFLERFAEQNQDEIQGVFTKNINETLDKHYD